MNKQEIYAFLQANGIPFAVTERKAVCSMEELGDIALPYPEWDAVQDDKKREYYLITVIGDRRVDLKAFRRAHGLRPSPLRRQRSLRKGARRHPFRTASRCGSGGCRRERCSAQARARCTAHRPWEKSPLSSSLAETPPRRMPSKFPLRILCSFAISDLSFQLMLSF